jgi:VanZ family protein
MLRTTGARLGTALLGYFAFVIVLLTLNPFYFELPSQLQIDLRIRPLDIIENVILFLPIGFLYRLTGGRHRGAILLGAALTVSIEAAQLLVPVRTAAPVDIVSNTLGAAIGTLLYDLVATRIAMTATHVGRLSLETPLMGLAYMLVPLLWMNALAGEVEPDRWVLAALIGVCGAIVFSDIARAWWGPAGLRTAWRVGLAAAAWLLLGSGPILLRPQTTLPLAAGVALLTAILVMLPWRSADRRFERTTLSRIFPILALYLLLAALWPPLRPLMAWHATLGLTDRVEAMTTRYPAPLLEYLAAFTVLGYVSAEWRGRAELSLARDLPRLLLVALGSALALEILVGFQVGRGASLTRLVMVVISALFGGVIYHLLRSHIRFLLSSAAPHRTRDGRHQAS